MGMKIQPSCTLEMVPCLWLASGTAWITKTTTLPMQYRTSPIPILALIVSFGKLGMTRKFTTGRNSRIVMLFTPQYTLGYMSMLSFWLGCQYSRAIAAS